MDIPKKFGNAQSSVALVSIYHQDFFRLVWLRV